MPNPDRTSPALISMEFVRSCFFGRALCDLNQLLIKEPGTIEHVCITRQMTMTEAVDYCIEPPSPGHRRAKEGTMLWLQKAPIQTTLLLEQFTL